MSAYTTEYITRAKAIQRLTVAAMVASNEELSNILNATESEKTLINYVVSDYNEEDE